MNRLLIFLNELSCLLQDPLDRAVILARVLLTLAALRNVRRLRHDVLVIGKGPIASILLGDGTYTVGTLLAGDQYRDEWRFIASLSQSSPWAAYPAALEPDSHQGVSHSGRFAIGMTWAKKNKSLVFSFGHPPEWNLALINARYDEIDAVGEVDSSAITIPNIAAPEHVESHRDALRDHGAVVSASSLVYDSNSFVIRMYAYDHNPPHFHVLLHRNTSDSVAKCSIGTLDVLAGYLPPALRSSVKEWARSHRNALMDNWERRRNGGRPLILEG